MIPATGVLMRALAGGWDAEACCGSTVPQADT
jgi:hypothetical protein